MACMQMSRCEAEKMKCSNGSEACYSSDHKQEVHKAPVCAAGAANASQGSYSLVHTPAGYAPNQVGHNSGGIMHNHSSHSNHSSGPHGHANHSASHLGHANHSSSHDGHANHGSGHQGCNNHSSGQHGSAHHGITNQGHHHNSSHHESCEFNENKKEHKDCKSGNMKIKKKSSKNYKCSDESSDSDHEGHGKKC